MKLKLIWRVILKAEKANICGAWRSIWEKLNVMYHPHNDRKRITFIRTNSKKKGIYLMNVLITFEL